MAEGVNFMQVHAGNRATGQVLQRMPTVQELQDKAGFSGGTTYSDLLDAIQFYHRLLRQKIGYDSEQVQRQGERLMDQLGKIQYLAQKYAKDHTHIFGIRDKRTKTLAEIPRESELERAVVRQRTRYWKTKVDAGEKNPPTWREVIPESMSGGIVDLDKAGSTTLGKKKGGTSEVKHLKLDDGSEGFFKADKKKIETHEWVNEETYKPAKKGEAKSINVETTEWNALKNYGYDAKKPGFARKAAATSRIDRLLNAGVAAHTELAYKKVGGKKVFGSYQRRAQGDDIPSYEGKVQLDEATNAAELSLADPNLQRQWSKLNVLDALTGQLDRHTGNLFVKLAQNGGVESLTGIDHDMSFPTKGMDDVTQRVPGREYSGLAQNLDREIVEMVMALEPGELIMILKDLLTEAEIKATIQRLQSLKAALSSRTKVEPTGWTKKTAQQEVKATDTFTPVGYLGHTRRNRKQKAFNELYPNG